MIRRRFLKSAAALIASPVVARSQTAQTLRFMPPSDLATLDPVWTTNYQTLFHAFLVFDTLFGLDGHFQPQPQMARGAVTEDGGKTWRITLRDGLAFHDGERVLARDCAASIRRWGAPKIRFGQTMLAATNEISAPEDRTIQIRLSRAFPLLPSALGKMTPNICAIMPERLATTDPYKQVSEMVGSGPYCFKADERVPGAKIVYVRNDKYMPRTDGLTEGTAGPKVAHFDRIEWHIISDPGTAATALQKGEIDWLQSPSVDLLPQLRKNERLKVEILNPLGTIATLRFNHLNPPFDNPAMRRAMVPDHAIAVAEDTTLGDNVGYFCPGTPMASNAGMGVLTPRRDLNSAKRAIDVADYKGEKIVVLLPTNDPILKALADVTIDMLKKLDLNVDAQAMDWPTVMQRRAKTEPVERGGWSLFDTAWPGQDMLIPIGHVYLRGNGKAAAAGWPDSPKIETLCAEWLNAPDIATQQAIAEKIQLQAFEDVLYIPLCQYFQSVAYQANLTGVLRRIPVFWNMRRT